MDFKSHGEIVLPPEKGTGICRDRSIDEVNGSQLSSPREHKVSALPSFGPKRNKTKKSAARKSPARKRATQEMVIVSEPLPEHRDDPILRQVKARRIVLCDSNSAPEEASTTQPNDIAPATQVTEAHPSYEPVASLPGRRA